MQLFLVLTLFVATALAVPHTPAAQPGPNAAAALAATSLAPNTTTAALQSTKQDTTKPPNLATSTAPKATRASVSTTTEEDTEKEDRKEEDDKKKHLEEYAAEKVMKEAARPQNPYADSRDTSVNIASNIIAAKAENSGNALHGFGVVLAGSIALM
ncbi:hypothetical protein L596_030245 [Steinernema carpocapsae]|uniref:Uncharacterized protein n=1 Tax=Steinernema carpocapsae TaxID=34508 RepID=A0A4U5LS64_STECR|nr:hypothetical protein L596_030245 [Steinernema carpocapsae]